AFAAAAERNAPGAASAIVGPGRNFRVAGLGVVSVWMNMGAVILGSPPTWRGRERGARSGERGLLEPRPPREKKTPARRGERGLHGPKGATASALGRELAQGGVGDGELGEAPPLAAALDVVDGLLHLI